MSELELHAPNVRRIVVRIAAVKRSWLHAATFSIEPAEGGGFTEFYLRDDSMHDPTDVHLSDRVDARPVVKHIWSVLCEAGLEYASKHSLVLIRGQFELQGANGEPLNDADSCNKNLVFHDPAKPYTEPDQELSKGEASAYGQLRFALTENRRLSTSLRSHQERDEERAESRAAGERALREQSRQLSDQMVAFAQYEKKQVAADLNEMRSEIRFDMVTEGFMKLLDRHGDMLAHSAGVYMRTGGGQQSDGKRVPDMPDDILLWVLGTFGPEQYAAFSAECIKARTIPPTEAGYELAWLGVLGVLNDSLEGVELPALLAAKIKAWAVAGVEALGVDPHTYSRLVFAEGVADDQVGQGAGVSGGAA